MPDRIQHTAVVPTEFALERLDQVATTLFPQYSRSMIQGWIRSGHLLIDGNRVKASKKISGGELIAIDAEIDDLEFQPEEIPLHVVFEDDDILVINKPAGLVVHPGAGNTSGTLLNALLHHVPVTLTLPRAGIVHRLDKDTTGMIVVAKTLHSHNRLVQHLSMRKVSRQYLAVVHGCPSSGTVDEPIGRHPTVRTKMAVTSGGKEAITRYAVERRFGGFSQLLVDLDTGRTHQIRVHMQHIGHPIVGDPVYGKRKKENPALPVLSAFPRQALHARRLVFEHPVTGKQVEFSAPVPDDMGALIDELGAAV